MRGESTCAVVQVNFVAAQQAAEHSSAVLIAADVRFVMLTLQQTEHGVLTLRGAGWQWEPHWGAAV